MNANGRIKMRPSSGIDVDLMNQIEKELVGRPCHSLASTLSRIDRIRCIGSHAADGIRAASESHNRKYSSNWNDM
ncbi:hypothetical protein BLM14_05440 [Phyllobacterium zundukense]|nr:hypothetical protein BLM14_05440 [Phyllobacterium zundukense]